MARLREQDLQAILGPDYKRIIQAEMEQDKPVTAEQIEAARIREDKRLGEIQFTMGAVILCGIALNVSTFVYRSISIESMVGIAFIVLGLVAMLILSRKRRALSGNANGVFASA